MDPARPPIHTLASVPILVCVFVLLTSGAIPAMASPASASTNATVPDDGPAHGVDSTDFYLLWSDDVDGDRAADDVDDDEISSRQGAERALAKSTDVPFERPPEAAEDWTTGDFGDYTGGGSNVSLAPTDANLTDGVYIQDAFVTIAAILPSTILHDSPPTNSTETTRANASNTTQYVAPDGDVLVASDYRVALPEGDDSGPQREEWSVTESSIEDVVLDADEQIQSLGSGHRSRLWFSNLSGLTTLEVRATITATLERANTYCQDWDPQTDSCDGQWKERATQLIETTETVSETRSVEVNRFSNVSGTRVEFESAAERSGVALHPDTKWSSITVEGDVQAWSNWWFYAAGAPGWNELEEHTIGGSSRVGSSVRPVQVHAFPSDEEPYVPTQPRNGTVPLHIEQIWGDDHAGPRLPPTIDLETPARYTNADSIALSSETLDDQALQSVTVHGIVRGQSQTVTLSDQRTVRDANLSLTVIDENSTQATVRAVVTENTTGDPVSSGQVAIGTETASLDANGTAVLTIQGPDPVIRGTYVPEEWWRTDHPYSSATTTVLVTGGFDLRAFIDLVLVTLLWFVPVSLLVVGLDYVTDGELLGLKRHS